MNDSIYLSVVIPLYNEELLITKLCDSLNRIIKNIEGTVEVIFVNDGSTDKTEEKLRSVKLLDKKTIITFSRNFGHQAALFAGMVEARGKFVVTMDGDLQHPPELIPVFLDLHKQGYDIVLTKRKDSVSVHNKSVLSFFFYSLINYFSNTQIPVNSSDFRSLSRQALDSLLSLPEKKKFLRGMVSWLGYTVITVPYVPNNRILGESKYTFLKMISLAFTGITSFSTFPLYFSGFFSLILFLLAVLYGAYVLYIRFYLEESIQGWASVVIVLLIIGAFLSLFLGLMGVYLAGIYEELKSRPLYIIKNRYK